MICGALLFGPLMGGMALGRLLRRLRVPAWIGAILFCLGPTAGLTADWIPLGFWNLAGIGIGAGAGTWIGLSADLSLPGLALMTGLTLVGVGVLEVRARWEGHRPEPWKGFPALVQPTMKAAIERGEIPRRWGGGAANPTSLTARPYLVHLGDSMIANGRFTARLDQLLPALAHENLGMPGTGTDVQFVELLRWLDAAPRPPLLVVHHLFSGNDIDDLDQDYDFCANHMVVEYEPDGVYPCRHLRWQFSLRDLINQSPPPYLLWIASSYLAVASQALDGVRQLHIATANHGPTVEHGTVAADWEQRWAHFEALMKAEHDELQRRGIALVASVLPFRGALESTTPQTTLGWRAQTRMLEVLRRLQIPALDFWPPLFDAVRREGSPAWFKPGQDVHFNDRGVDLYDGWLAPQLPSLIADESGTQPALGPSK